MYDRWKNLLLTVTLVCSMTVETYPYEPPMMKIPKEKTKKMEYNDLSNLDSKIRLKLDTLYSYEVKTLVNLKKESCSFDKFAYAMKFKESSLDYKIVNRLGYYGAYQFGKPALDILGIKKDKSFLLNSHLQDAAFIAYCKHNKWILKRYINTYQGKKINGIMVTESGLLAAAHLMGAGTVIKWINLNGKMNTKAKCDANGTNLEYYMKVFSGFDTSTLVASRRIHFQLNS